MTTTTRSPLHELSIVKSRYEQKLGWRVSVDPHHHRLVMQIGAGMDAIVLPARLAGRALSELGFAMLDGPVAAAPGGHWMTFLTLRTASPNPCLPVELQQARVQLVPREGQVILPNSLVAHDNPTVWRWVQAPRQHRPLPPWCAVIAAARRAARW